jgi:hypothetical protein
MNNTLEQKSTKNLNSELIFKSKLKKFNNKTLHFIGNWLVVAHFRFRLQILDRME